jgi:hypothetical protein
LWFAAHAGVAAIGIVGLLRIGPGPLLGSGALRTADAVTSRDGTFRMAVTSKAVTSRAVTSRTDGVAPEPSLDAAGEGVFDVANRRGHLSVIVPGASGPGEIVVVGDTLYSRLPGNEKWTRTGLPLGPSVTSGTYDPSTFFAALQRVQGEAVDLGPDLGRGAGVPLVAEGVDPIVPIEVWLDDAGRLRRMIETVAAQRDGGNITVTLSIEIWDFGTPVEVSAPPDEDVEDGQTPQAVTGTVGVPVTTTTTTG